MTKIIINGYLGKMGQMVAALALTMPESYEVVAGVDVNANGEQLSIQLYKSLYEVPNPADVVIDFSRPEALQGMLEYCTQKRMALVLATTGLTPEQLAMVEQAGRQIPIFRSANMSLGVNLQLELVKRAALTLGEAFDVEIIEKHHNTKVDAPSGTALMLADGIRDQYPQGREYIYDRHNRRQKRDHNEIGMAVLRGGTVVGEHQVHFFGTDEVLEITHTAQSRKVFAAGALWAAEFIVNKQSGVYSMQDIVAEKNKVTQLYADDNQTIVTVSNVSHKSGQVAGVFAEIASEHINIDMISQTAPHNGVVEVSFSLPDQRLEQVLSALKRLMLDTKQHRTDVISALTKITIAGTGMASHSGIAAKLFKVLADAQINVVLITTSETKISYCVAAQDKEKAIAVTREQFGL